MKQLFIVIILMTSLAHSQTRKPISKASVNKVLVPYRVKNLWGLSDTLGKIKIQPIYKDIADLNYYKTGPSNRATFVVKTNKNYFVINQNGTILLPELNNYDSIRLYKYNTTHIAVYKKGKAGVYYKNREVVPCLYENVYVDENESYVVTDGSGLKGLVNSHGKVIIPIEYRYINSSSEEADIKNVKFVWKAEGQLTDKKFYDVRIKKDLSVEELDLFSKVISEMVERNDQKELEIEKKLKVKYDDAQIDESNQLATVSLNNKKGIIDLNNDKVIIDLSYDYVVLLSENKGKRIFLVKNNSKSGIIEENNKVTVPVEYDEIKYDYDLGSYLMTKDNRKGILVLNTIYPLISAKYDAVISKTSIPVNSNWSFGLFKVKTANGEGYVGENGVEFFKD